MAKRGSIWIILIVAAMAAYGLFAFVPSPVFKTKAAQSAESPSAQAPIKLDILARIGPWPVASRLIGYRGRIWFAGSVKGRNHNSADIWSMDPTSGVLRYERNLFSQDAGLPLVYNGLLYWPLEDALLSFGNGAVAVTNGNSWQQQTIANAPIYHTSEVIDYKGDLLAVTGTRNAGLQLSKDDGRSWQEIYIHPTPDTHISRFTEMTMFDGRLYGFLRDAWVKRLVVWTGKGFENVEGWPQNKFSRGLTPHNGALYAILGQGKERQLWKFDGKQASRFGDQGSYQDLASDGDNLWVITSDRHLWSVTGANRWSRHGDLAKGRPIDAEIIDGRLYVSGAGDDGHAIIWGPGKHNFAAGNIPSSATYSSALTGAIKDWDKAGADIDTMLADIASFEQLGSGRLRHRIFEAATSNPPRGFFTDRMRSPIASGEVKTFRSSKPLHPDDLRRALMLWAMTLAKHPEVPVGLLGRRWTAKQNSFEKYLDPPIGALRAIAASRQNDRATISALIKRLDHADDPEWLRSQVIGTLTAVTGEHFGYDIKAWKEWHQRSK